MSKPPWLEKMREEVKQQGLPPQYVERLLREMTDHLNEIQEEDKGMDAENIRTPDERLGEPGDLAGLIGNEYRNRHFSGRHPVAFAVVSIALLSTPFLGMLWLDIRFPYEIQECYFIFPTLFFGLWSLFRSRGRLRRFWVGFVIPCMAAILGLLVCPPPLLDRFITPYTDMADLFEITYLPPRLVGSLGNELWGLHLAIVYFLPVLVAALTAGMVGRWLIPAAPTPGDLLNREESTSLTG
jgi:hypothetical protein